MRLLLIGFPEEEVQRILKETGIPVIPVPEHFKGLKVREILERTCEKAGIWTDRKFVIMHGVDNETLKRVISIVRGISRERVIFATTTETSLEWPLERLLHELIQEDEYFRAMREAKKQVPRGPYLDLGIGKG
ncbi:DUF3783 domain-containing protein [Thermococcus sp.]|uniref:DUF3783 domain-containing protein n=1 Tax=Thermococcus sp. TaxID=35749 RepID=UPI0026161B9E|nr:DUF3783 domain-containing protein [Thermococcus sp.]